MDSRFSRFLHSAFRGLGQLVFSDSTAGGVIVLIAIAIISPWSGVGAVSGVIVGTCAGYFLSIYPRNLWQIGLSGYNSAIVGILWGPLLANGIWDIHIFSLALFLCVTLEILLLNLFHRFDLPVLSLPSVLAIYVIATLYGIQGEWFWVISPSPPFGSFGITLSILCIIAAMMMKSLVGTIQVVLLSVFSAALASWAFQVNFLALSGLWAFTVAPASFGIHAIFLGGSTVGSFGGVIAALIGSIIWVIWVVLGVEQIAPPLLLPFILGSLITILVFRKLASSVVTWAAILKASKMLLDARKSGNSIVAITGSGIREISSFATNEDIYRFTLDDFRISPYNRRIYWDECEKIHSHIQNRLPSKGESVIEELLLEGWIESIISEVAGGYRQSIENSMVMELQGRIDRVNCIDCGSVGQWPPKDLWNRYDIRCPVCSGLLKPSVLTIGEELPQDVTRQAERAVNESSILLVVGVNLTVQRSVHLINQAKSTGSKIVIINNGPNIDPLHTGDLIVTGEIETNLLALVARLRRPWLVNRVCPLLEKDPFFTVFNKG